VKSDYSRVSLDNYLIRRTQANYSGEVTMCDRWFGYFLESLRVMGLLENTMIIFTTDHGHSICDRGYLGKRGYPSMPEVYEVPLMIRLPGARHAGKKVFFLIQHHDLAATILKEAGVKLPPEIEGKPFLQEALKGKKSFRDHVTVGWNATPTVITERWWLNYKADGTGVFLYNLKQKDPFSTNVASRHPEVVKHLMKLALADAGGSFPDWIVELARKQPSAPGCSDIAAREK